MNRPKVEEQVVEERIVDDQVVDDLDDDQPDAAEIPWLKTERPWWKNWRIAGAATAVIAVVAAGGSLAARRPQVEPAPGPVSGTLEISSNPASVEAYIDGALRGATPLLLALDPGPHVVELRWTGTTRTIPLTIQSGMKVSQHVELGKETASGRGAPATAARTASPGSAAVETRPDSRSVETGTVSVTSPITLEVFEHGSRIGGSGAPLALAPGRHELELVNAEFDVRSSTVVQVAAGRTSPVTLQLPNGILSLNATPWAEVWIDGERIGETPIGNLSVRVGSHGIVFRHPELGERHETVVVTSRNPARVSVNLTEK